MQQPRSTCTYRAARTESHNVVSWVFSLTLPLLVEETNLVVYEIPWQSNVFHWRWKCDEMRRAMEKSVAGKMANWLAGRQRREKSTFAWCLVAAENFSQITFNVWEQMRSTWVIVVCTILFHIVWGRPARLCARTHNQSNPTTPCSIPFNRMTLTSRAIKNWNEIHYMHHI